MYSGVSGEKPFVLTLLKKQNNEVIVRESRGGIYTYLVDPKNDNQHIGPTMSLLGGVILSFGLGLMVPSLMPRPTKDRLWKLLIALGAVALSLGMAKALLEKTVIDNNMPSRTKEMIVQFWFLGMALYLGAIALIWVKRHKSAGTAERDRV
jgi:uncharacterized membrane protein YbjE (DUF340 family)